MLAWHFERVLATYLSAHIHGSNLSMFLFPSSPPFSFFSFFFPALHDSLPKFIPLNINTNVPILPPQLTPMLQHP